MKNNTLYFYLTFVLLSISGLVSGQTMIGNTQVEVTSLVTGLDTPWEILWGPEDHIWMTERRGVVSRIDPETGQLVQLVSIDEVYEQGEAGLLGMALHPDFPGTPYLYVVYNYYDGAIKEKVVRYEFTGTTLENPFTLIEGIAGNGNHNGSRLLIDENYKLFVTTGDAGNSTDAQNMNSLNGKILRMNLDGSIPDDNPLGDSYIWTLGHRNPQGLIIAPNGKMYSSEHGPSDNDEFNLIEKGRNYGWPQVHGFCDETWEQTFCTQNNVYEPLYAWTPTLATAGIEYYGDESIPEWTNSILMTTLKASELVSLKLNGDGTAVTGTSVWFAGTYGRLRDVCVSPDGRVFIAVSNKDGRGAPAADDDKILEIKVTGVTSTSVPDMDSEISIVPQPMTDQTLISLNDELLNGRITLFDLSGRPVFKDVFSGNQYLLKRGQLQKGYYVLEISDSERNKTRTLLAVF